MTAESDRIWIIAADGAVRTGFFRARLVRGGPYVAARCWIEPGEREPVTGDLLSDDVTRLEVDGAEVNPFAPGYVLAGEKIDEREYRYLIAMRGHALTHEPDMPEAQPRRPVDFNNLHFDF